MWKIYDKTGTIEKVDLSQLTYTGNFMEENFITMTIYSPCPINLEIGDYIEYRGEKFELNYFPTAQKNSSTWSSGDAYVYDSVKFNSFSHELKTCDFIDVVLSDNNIHFTLLPVFQFFASTVKDLADRIQANLDRIYTGDRKWTITVDDNAAGLTDINVSVNKVKCWDALLLSKSLFGVNFIIRGRTVTIGKTGLSVGKVFGYGKNNGFISIKQNTNSDALFITRLRAYGSTRNLPDNYYNRLKKPDGTALIPESMYVKNLMLPSFRKDGITAYIDSPNIDEYGIREDSVYFDGSDQSLPNVFPSMEGMTAEDLASAGIIVNATGRLDEIVSAEQITDSGVPPEGEELSKITFTVTLKDLGFDPKEHKTTETPLLAMKSGTCNSREFEILDCVKQGNNYVLTCERSYDKSINVYFPNKYYNLEADDRFVFLNIEMDELYILAAEQRLLTAAQDYLSKHDKTKFIYEPKIDNVFMARNPIFHDTIKEGDVLDFSDTDFDINDSVIIQTLTIKEGGEVPEYEITLYNDTGDTKTQNIQGSIKSLEDQVNITSEELNDARNLISLFGIDSNGNVYLKRGRDFYTYGGISALGSGIPGTGGSGGSYSLSELIDVELSNLAAGQLLKYDGTHWINFDQSEITPDLTGYATESWVTGKGYITASDLVGYATESWVTGKGYITASALVGYATESWVNEQGFLKSSALDNYVNLDGTQSITGTKSFTADTTIFKSISINGFLIDTDGNGNLRLNGNVYSTGGVSAGGPGAGGGGGSASSLSELSDVSLSGLTAGQLLKYNGSHWVNFDQSEITPDLTGYATESWVQSQGYLTEHQDLSGYLPSSGGTMTGDIIFNNNVNIRWKNITGDTLGQLYFNNNNILVVGNRSNAGLVLRTGSTDILHDRNGDSYKVWDSFNLPNPAGSTDLDGYLSLTAGPTKPLAGKLYMNAGARLLNNKALYGLTSKGNEYPLIHMSSNDTIKVGSIHSPIEITSEVSDVLHNRAGTTYKIWDSYNLPNPATEDDLNNYLPLSAGSNKKLTGELYFSQTNMLRASDNNIILYSEAVTDAGPGRTVIGNYYNRFNILTVGTDVLHNRVIKGDPGHGTPYKMWDAYNLPNPVVSTDLNNYLPLSAGASAPLTGKLYAAWGMKLSVAGVSLTGVNSTGREEALIYISSTDDVVVGDQRDNLVLHSVASDLIHRRGASAEYKIWDAYNLSSPATTTDLNSYIPRSAQGVTTSLLNLQGGIYRGGASMDGEFGYACNMLLRFDSGGTNWYTGGILSISTGGELRVAGVSNGTLSVWRDVAMQGMVNNFLHDDNEVTLVSQAAAIPHLWFNYRGCAGGISDYHLGSGKGDSTHGNLALNYLHAMEGIKLANGKVLTAADSTGAYRNLVYVSAGSDIAIFGDNQLPLRFRSTNGGIAHSRWINNEEKIYTIWDSYDVPSPVSGSGGVAGQLAKWSAATALSGGMAYSSGNTASTVVARDGNGAFAATSISVTNLNATNLGTGGGDTIIHVGLIPRINNACYIGNSTYQFAQVYSANYNIKLSNGTDRITLMNYQDRLSIAKNGGADTMGVNIGSLLVSGNLSDYTKVPNYGIYVSGNIVANGGVSAAGVSDARLKHDINPLDDALSLINMVKVKTFRYNSIARELDNNLPVRDAGFIAQEFVKVFPEHVKEMYDGKYLGIRYDKMIPYLTRGIQEVDNNTRKIKQVTVEILDIIGSTGIGEPVKMKIHELLNTLNTIR